MSKSIVILDTNILILDRSLKSEAWTALYGHAKEWALHFAVPEVVVMETVNKLHQKWQTNRKQLTDLEWTFASLDHPAEYESLLSAHAARSENCEAELTSRCAELGVEVVPLPATIDHMDIARRAAEGRAPYARVENASDGKPKAGKAKDGYRDTLIWLTVLSVADQNPECDVWFVSDNYKDFGVATESKDQRDTLAYPLAWHPDLGEELSGKGLTDRVFYARSLPRLEQYLLSRFAPLPEEDLEALWAKVERSELHDHMTTALFATPVDPRAAALPLDTEFAWVRVCVRAGDAVRFSEAGRRAAGTWTAQFRCEIEATIEVTSRAGDVTDVTKPLVIYGRITLNAEHEVTDLTIEAIEADPKDPQRRAWTRADAAAKAGNDPARYKTGLSQLTFDMPAVDMMPGLKAAVDSISMNQPQLAFDMMPGVKAVADSLRVNMPQPAFDLPAVDMMPGLQETINAIKASMPQLDFATTQLIAPGLQETINVIKASMPQLDFDIPQFDLPPKMKETVDRLIDGGPAESPPD